MSSLRGVLESLIRKARSSEWARWGTYRSIVRGELQRLQFPGFKFEAWKKDAAEYGRWKAAFSANVRKEAIENAEKFGRWWWKLPISYRLGSAAVVGFVTAFGIDLSSSIIGAGRRLIFSGRGPDYIENAYNRLEGLSHSSEERSKSRTNTTDFGSGWQHGTTIRKLREIFKDRILAAKVSAHASHVGKAVWLERVAKEQVGYWPGKLSRIGSKRPQGVVFEFPEFFEKIAGAEIHGGKGILRIHKDIPIRMANKVIVPSHERLWQRIFENMGLGHIKVERLKAPMSGINVPIDLVETTAVRGARVVQPRFTPPAVALNKGEQIIGSRYNEVKASMSGVQNAQANETKNRVVRYRKRQLSKLRGHKKPNLALEMHDRRVRHNIVDDMGKNSHLF